MDPSKSLSLTERRLRETSRKSPTYSIALGRGEKQCQTVIIIDGMCIHVSYDGLKDVA